MPKSLIMAAMYSMSTLQSCNLTHMKTTINPGQKYERKQYPQKGEKVINKQMDKQKR
jgi:hypothetical protein